MKSAIRLENIRKSLGNREILKGISFSVEIGDIFGIERSVVTKHIGKILKDKEVNHKSNVQKMHIANSDKPVKFYSLDMILAVGYRTNSFRAIIFRQWANKILKSHIVGDSVITRSKIDKNYTSFLNAVDDLKKLVSKDSKSITDDILELVRMFASTWFSLDSYDKAKLPKSGASKKKVIFTAEELKKDLFKLKKELINKKEATELFAKEKHKNNLEGIVGNVLQSFSGKNVYLTLEEKAAHLLYFIVKNHPFTDGNKRSGAFAFIWFLRRFDILDTNNITPEALTALTLLIAESKPSEKDRMIGLVLLLLKKN